MDTVAFRFAVDATVRWGEDGWPVYDVPDTLPGT
jgi:hypothetical protein